MVTVMKAPESAIIWTFWRSGGNGGCLVSTFLLCALVWSIAWFWPAGASSSIFFGFWLFGLIFGLRTSTLIDDHHLNLPITTARLSFLACAYAFVLAAFFALLALTGFNLLGGQWNLLPTTLAAAVLATMTVGLANSVHTDDQPGLEAILVAMIGVFGMMALGLALDLGPGNPWIIPYRIPILLSLLLLSWWLARGSMSIRRRTGESIVQRLMRFDFALGEVWRPRTSTPKDPIDGIIELDWRRFLEGSAVAGVLSVFVLLLLYVLSDEQVAFFGWLSIFMIIPCSIYFVTKSFWTYDHASNGAFRWTLPVSDIDLAHGMLRCLFRTIFALWFAWVFGLLVIWFAHWWMGQNLLADMRGTQRMGATGTFVFLTALCVGSLLVSWVCGSMGLVHTYIGRRRDYVIAVGVIWCPIAFLVFLQKCVPESNHYLVTQIALNAVGCWMLTCTLRVYAYAEIAEFFTREQTRWMMAIWLIVSVAVAVPTVWFGIGAGTAVFISGLLALAFHPLASMPFAIQAVRHWYRPDYS